MADLVRDDIDVEAERLALALVILDIAGLDVAGAGLSVALELGVGDQLDPLAGRLEQRQQIDLGLEIVLPDVQDPPGRAEHVRRVEASRADRKMIEVAVGIGLGGRVQSALPRRQGSVVVGRLVDRVEDPHALVGRPGLQAAGQRRDPDGLRLPVSRQARRLREQAKPAAGGRELGVQFDRHGGASDPDATIRTRRRNLMPRRTDTRRASSGGRHRGSENRAAGHSSRG